MQSATLPVSPALTLSDSQDLKFNNTFPKLTLILSKKTKQLEISYSFTSSNVFVVTHRLQTYTHRVLVYYGTFIPEPIPTVRGMRLFVILLEKTASPPFPSLAPFYTSWACRYTLGVCVCVLGGKGVGTSYAVKQM